MDLNAASEIGKLTPSWAGGAAMMIGEVILGVLPWMLLCGFGGFILALVACIYLGKKKLLTRATPVWNALAKLSIPVLLIGLPLAGAACGSIYGLQRASQAILEKSVQPALAGQMPALRAMLGARLKSYRPDRQFTTAELVDSVVQEMRYVPQSGGQWERAKAYLLNDMLARNGGRILAQTLQGLMAERVAVLGENREMAQFGVGVVKSFSADDAQKVDFAKLDARLPQLFIKAVKTQLNGLFSGLYINLALLLLAVLLLIAGEIWYYHRIHLARPTPAA